MSDLQMPGMTGLELLAALQQRPSSPPLILVTAHGSERVAVDAMKLGAVDYFRKPLDADEIAMVVRRHMGLVRLTSENQRLRGKLALSRTMVFESAAMQRVGEIVERVGYADDSTFRRLFRKHTTLSPRNYRQRFGLDAAT